LATLPQMPLTLALSWGVIFTTGNDFRHRELQSHGAPAFATHQEFFPEHSLDSAFSSPRGGPAVLEAALGFADSGEMQMRFWSLVLLTILIHSPGHAALPYRATIVDSANLLSGHEREDLLGSLDAAVADWNRFLKSPTPIWIELEITRLTPTGRFSGTSASAFALPKQGDIQIVELGATHKLRTGISANESLPDIRIQIEIDYLRSEHWIDPHPELRTDPVPIDKVDLITTLAHEMGHGFGMAGWRDLNTVQMGPGRLLSVFDTLVANSSSPNPAPVFTGAHANQICTSGVPLTWYPTQVGSLNIQHNGKSYLTNQYPSQNVYHLGRFSTEDTESDLSFFALMAGNWISKEVPRTQGFRAQVNALDAAVIQDLIETANHLANP